MDIGYSILLSLGIFLLTLAIFPLILDLMGRTIQKKAEWKESILQTQELKTQLAFIQSAYHNQLDEEKALQYKYEVINQDLSMLRGELEGVKSAREFFENQMVELKGKVEDQFGQLDVEKNTQQGLKIENERLKEFLRSQNEKFADQKKELESIGEKFETSFRNLANSILEDRTQKFDLHQQTSLKHILEPLQKDIEIFKKDFGEKFQNETHQRISLGSQIENLMKMSNKLSEEASHLTQALKGQVKQQGNWGEAILESILQFAGLQKGVQYFVQESQINELGHRIQPDIRVQYPDNKHIIIDSKVSLLHYERFSNTDVEEDKGRHLSLLVASMKNHIQDLSSKNYQNGKDNTLDFVMMFVPVEGAFITAMQADQELWQTAYRKRILLISPTNLIAAMKLVQDFWQKDQNHKKSEEIASKAAALYDKLVGFVEHFSKIGDSINKADNAFQEAKKVLSTGKGNLIGRAEQMKRINGMKTVKNLPSDLVSGSLLEEVWEPESDIPEES